LLVTGNRIMILDGDAAAISIHPNDTIRAPAKEVMKKPHVIAAAADVNCLIPGPCPG
jgi:hypothetical protein